MIRYLTSGWYAAGKQPQLRSEVIDGAIDAAGMLFRAGVPPQVVSEAAFKLRALVSIVDPFMRGDARFGPRQRSAVGQRLEPLTSVYPVLHAFITDCLDHVNAPRDMRALYLHLVHVAQMIELLAAAMGPFAGMVGGGDLPSPAETKKPTRKASAKKSGTKKKATGTRARKKVATKKTSGKKKATKKASQKKTGGHKTTSRKTPRKKTTPRRTSKA